MAALFKKKDLPRRSAAREQLAPPPKYYRSGKLSDKAASPFKPKARKSNKTTKILVGLADFGLIFLILLGLVYSLIVKPRPQIKLDSTEYRQASAYQDAAVKQFQMLKNRNKISLDEQGIVSNLKLQFPEVASASVELPLFSEIPVVHLNIAKPSFFILSNNRSYIVDDQGKVVAVSTTLPQIKNLPQVIDQTGFKIKAGEQALSAGSVAFINTVIAEAKRAKVPVASLSLPSLAQELDLRTTDRQYFVKFFLGGDAVLQCGQFLAARHNFDQGSTQPSQYLDVRVSGKIYYK